MSNTHISNEPLIITLSLLDFYKFITSRTISGEIITLNKGLRSRNIEQRYIIFYTCTEVIR